MATKLMTQGLMRSPCSVYPCAVTRPALCGDKLWSLIDWPPEEKLKSHT